jgi:hypothetical protein
MICRPRFPDANVAVKFGLTLAAEDFYSANDGCNGDERTSGDHPKQPAQMRSLPIGQCFDTAANSS